MRKRLFIVIIEDRHTDVQVELWLEEAEAITRARTVAKERWSAESGVPYSEKLSGPMKKAGWLFHVTYSGEGDAVRVERKDVLIAEDISAKSAMAGGGRDAGS